MIEQKSAEEQLQEALAENAALKAENGQLKAAAANCTCTQATAKAPAEPIKVGEKEYKWIGPLGFVFDGTRYAAEEAITDAELIGKLLALPGQTFLQELV